MLNVVPVCKWLEIRKRALFMRSTCNKNVNDRWQVYEKLLFRAYVLQAYVLQAHVIASIKT